MPSSVAPDEVSLFYVLLAAVLARVVKQCADTINNAAHRLSVAVQSSLSAFRPPVVILAPAVCLSPRNKTQITPRPSGVAEPSQARDGVLACAREDDTVAKNRYSLAFI